MRGGVALQAVAAVALTCATAVRCSLLLLDEAANLTTGVCLQKERCSKRARQIASADIFPRTFFAYPCFCDEDCHLYQDCCHDLALNESLPQHPGEELILGFPASAWACQLFTLVEYEALNGHIQASRNSESTHAGTSFLKQHAWMVSECPYNAHPALKEQCAADGPERTYLHDLPTIAGGILFRNQFCAYCHDMGYQDFYPLNLEIVCESSNATNADLAESIYGPGELKFYLQDNSTCRMNVREFKNMSKLSKILEEKKMPPLRQCRADVIGWCPEGFHDEELVLKCSQYLMIVQEIKNSSDNSIRKVFKNPHCAICNNVTLFSCGKDWSHMPLVRHPPSSNARAPSLSLIFHFSFGGSNLVGHESCSEGFTWDSVFQKCQPYFTCSSDARFRSADCPDNESHLTSQDGSSNSSIECNKVVLDQGEFTFLPNGSILLNDTGSTLGPEEFYQLDETRVETCADNALVPDDTQGGESSFSALEGTLTLVCTTISLIGLALHILVMLAIPKLRNLPGLISMGISISLMVAQLLFLIATGPARPTHVGVCIAMAAVLHFAFLSVFAWTAVMSFDIWRTFSHPTGQISGRKSHTRKTQFLKYCAFAALVPLAVVGIAVALDLSGLDAAVSPQYGQSTGCWFGSRYGLAIFFALPVLLILVGNLGLYTLVVLRIREQRKATKYLEGRHSSRHSRYTESDCKLHFSIFNVMGGTWFLGLIAGLVDHPVLWIAYIILNGSQGAIIFALQILKPRVLHMIRNRITGKEDTTTSGSGSGRTSGSALLNRNSERSSAAISFAGGSINLKSRVE